MDIKLIFRALKHRNYRLFFIGQVVSLTGTWMQMVAMSWLVYRMTNSALLLGLVGFLGQMPSFFLTPFAGVIADRYNRRKILLITQISAMLQALVLSFLVMTNSVQVWQVVLLSMVLGFVNSFDIPVRQAFTIEMIENKEDLGNAIALNSSMVNIARLIGPSVAGIIVATLGEGPCFLLNALSYVAVIVSLSMMRILGKERRKERRHVLHELKEGFAYAYNFIPIKHILILLSVVSLTGVPYQVLMPIFAKDIFHGGAQTLGFLMSMAGCGALMGAIYLAARKSIIGLGRIIAQAALCFGIGVSVFSFCRNFWLALLLICIAGFSMMVQMAASNTILQTIVEEDKRGRIMSFYSMSFIGITPFGSLLAGILASRIGAPFTLLSGGVCCIITAMVFWRKLPLIRKHIHPIYVKKGIIPDEVVKGIGAASGLEVLSEK
ncbi:MAG: MFS transporter [Candidatus Omnitrophica bacterium]|nr:MFS transporter [Candidatus Omnitrophota bacterium]MDD5653827.1 MFS transporter [Candidatus Omnitrophota bacterium]